MAKSYQRVVSDGTLVLLPLSIEYQSRGEISVYINDVRIAPGSGPWSWVGTTSTSISFSPAVPNTQVVYVIRKTSIDEALHIFEEGAQFIASSLDDNFEQLVHAVQDMREVADSGLPVPPEGIQSFQGRTTPDAIVTQADIEALGFVTGGGLPGAVVETFNTRSGAVTLMAGDISAALGYVPAAATATSPASIAALRAAPSGAVNGSTTVTRGYYLPGDGGGSEYFRDTSDVTSSDNGGSVIVATDGGRWKLAKGTVYSARQFGTKGDSSYGVPGTDDTVALQRLITYCMLTGTRGYIPAGRYRCTNQLNIPENCYLYGDGWKDVRDMVPSISPTARDWTQSKVVGTIIYADFMAGVNPAQMYVTGNSVTIKDMEFEVNQPPPSAVSWTTNNTPLAVYAWRDNYYEQGGNSLTMDSIMLRNHNNGIKLFGVSRGYLNNIYGQNFGTSIDISHSGDVVRVNNVHVNWSFFAGGPATATIDYMNANAKALAMGRVDNPIITNFFTFGGHVGIHHYVDTIVPDGGSTFRAQYSNIGLDNIEIGVKLDDACSVNFTNMYVYNRAVTNSRGIHGVAVLGGGYVPQRIQLVNCDFEGSQAEAIRLEVPGKCNVANVQITNYNGGGGSFPGIAVYSGMDMQIANLSNTTLSGSPLTQAIGTGTISIAGSGGGGAGVASFNTRTGVVTLASSDVTSALTYTPANRAGDDFTGKVGVAGNFRSTNTSVHASGAGVELNYDTGLTTGFLNAYDRTAALYKNLSIGGATINFKSNAAGTNAAFFDTTGDFVVGYASNQGTYKLQVNGNLLVAGTAFTSTPSTGTTGTRVATCDYVINKIAAAAVASFNTRTGAVTLTSGDVTGALTYTPPNPAGTIRSTNSSALGSGVGMEMNWDTGLTAGFLIAYNRGTSAYQNMNIAGSTITFKSGTGTNAALFDANQSLLIGYSSTNGSTYKLQVNSQIFASNATIATSDARVKQDFEALGECTSYALALARAACTYRFIPNDPVHHFATATQVGWKAQDVAAILDSTNYKDCVVMTNEDGDRNLMGMAKENLIPILFKTIQELEARIRALEGRA